MSTTTTSWKSRFGSRRMSKDNSLQGSDDTAKEQQEASPAPRRNKKGMRGRLSRLLPASNHSQSKLTSRDPSPVQREPTPPKQESPETKSSSSSSSDEVVPATATAETTTTRTPRAARNVCLQNVECLVLLFAPLQSLLTCFSLVSHPNLRRKAKSRMMTMTMKKYRKSEKSKNVMAFVGELIAMTDKSLLSIVSRHS